MMTSSGKYTTGAPAHSDEKTLIELQDMKDPKRSSSHHLYRVALLIPMCGPAGIWAPSCIASAQVAVRQINERGGILGQKIQLLVIDAAEEAETPIEWVVNDLIEDGAIDAIVGMHISAVRQKLSKIVQQRIPYVYTPLYEGGETTKGIFAIGDTPTTQLGPAIERLSDEHGLKSWALIGNNYVWPHASHSYARDKIKALGLEVSYEKYLRFGVEDMSQDIKDIAETGADAVLISLVGQDAVTFNRAFGELNMHERILRLSCAIEENELLASGAENLVNLYSSSSYFSVIDSEENRKFKASYYRIHGDRAPTLNMIGQSTYEGVQFLASLLETHGRNHQDRWKTIGTESIDTVQYQSARRVASADGSSSTMPVYLAKAEGHVFKIVDKISQ